MGKTKKERIAALQKQLDEVDCYSDTKKWEVLADKLYELNPWGDMFHLGCANWPNCRSEGCGCH